MKNLFLRAILPPLLLTTALTAPAAAQTRQSIDEEIVRLRKELARTQLDCRRTGEETDKDRKEFESYKNRAAERMALARRQIDTLSSEIRAQATVNDSLAAAIASLREKRREIELAADAFRRRLIELCTTLLPFSRRLPPLVMTPAQSALSLLASDLSASAIDNNEGFSRLTQILNQMDEATSGIQVSQENSPVPDIRGMAYRLRIGSFFEAVVDTKGERCAIFAGWNGDGSPRWTMAGPGEAARKVLDAISIREGKKLPAFVTIALTPPADSSGNGGGK